MSKYTILCFGASNVWGFKPGSYNPKTQRAKRYDANTRWTMQLEKMLGPDKFKIIEEGLNGRTTMFDDTVANKPYRNGLTQLPIILEQQYPVDLIIFMLGTNDTKIQYNKTAQEITKGMKALINIVKSSNVNPHTTAPKILLIAPQPIQPINQLSNQFDTNSIKKSHQIIGLFKQLAEQEKIAFIDSSKHIISSEIDGIHMDEDQLSILASAIKTKILASIVDL